MTGTFTRYKSGEAGLHNVGNFAWAEPESEDYIVPYFLSTWVTLPKWEQTIANATSYRISKSGFTIDKIIYREWMTKNDKEVFVHNPNTYFDIYICDTIWGCRKKKEKKKRKREARVET